MRHDMCMSRVLRSSIELCGLRAAPAGVQKLQDAPFYLGAMLFLKLGPQFAVFLVLAELGLMADSHMARGQGPVDHLLGLHSRRCRCDVCGGGSGN